MPHTSGPYTCTCAMPVSVFAFCYFLLHPCHFLLYPAWIPTACTAKRTPTIPDGSGCTCRLLLRICCHCISTRRHTRPYLRTRHNATTLLLLTFTYLLVTAVRTPRAAARAFFHPAPAADTPFPQPRACPPCAHAHTPAAPFPPAPAFSHAFTPAGAALRPVWVVPRVGIRAHLTQFNIAIYGAIPHRLTASALPAGSPHPPPTTGLCAHYACICGPIPPHRLHRTPAVAAGATVPAAPHTHAPHPPHPTTTPPPLPPPPPTYPRACTVAAARQHGVRSSYCGRVLPWSPRHTCYQHPRYQHYLFFILGMFSTFLPLLDVT